MKNLIFLFLFFSTNCFAQYHFIDDETNTISENDKNKIESLLSSYEKETSIEIAAVIVNSTNGEDIEKFSRNLGNSLGVGKKELNNGIIFVTAIKDRKWRIIIGEGLNKFISGRHTQEMGQKTLTPYFKSNSYGQGIYQYLNEITVYLGNANWDLRMKQLARKEEIAKVEEEAARESNKNILSILLKIFVFGIMGGFVLFLIYRFFIKDMLYKKKVYKDYSKIISDATEILSRTKTKDEKEKLKILRETMVLENLQQKLNITKDSRDFLNSFLFTEIDQAYSYVERVETIRESYNEDLNPLVKEANEAFEYIKKNCSHNIIEDAEEYIFNIKKNPNDLKNSAHEFFLKQNFKNACSNIEKCYNTFVTIFNSYRGILRLKREWSNANVYVKENLKKLPEEKQKELKNQSMQNDTNMLDMILLMSLIQDENYSIRNHDSDSFSGNGGKFGGGGASSSWSDSDSSSHSSFDSDSFGGGSFSGGDSGGGGW